MEPIPYKPRYFHTPKNLIDVPTAWKGVEFILHDLITRFCPTATTCLELGVEHGYSTVALSNYFSVVVGVDTFAGDYFCGQRDPEVEYPIVRDKLLEFQNIRPIRSTWQDFFATNKARFDLVHIDVTHTFEDTFECGYYAARFADVILVHDTVSFTPVMNAVEALSRLMGMTFYNWPEVHGLGILVR